MATENPFLQVIRVWAGLAWADGVIADTERSALTKLIDQAGLSDEGKATALGFLDSQPELEVEGFRSGTPAMREGIYQAACRLAKVDQDIAAEERAFLDRLRDGLAIDEQTAAAIQQKVRMPD